MKVFSCLRKHSGDAAREAPKAESAKYVVTSVNKTSIGGPHQVVVSPDHKGHGTLHEATSSELVLTSTCCVCRGVGVPQQTVDLESNVVVVVVSKIALEIVY